jgi:hypothetical protein
MKRGEYFIFEPTADAADIAAVLWATVEKKTNLKKSD